MLNVEHLSKPFITERTHMLRAVDDVSFAVEQGKILTLLGPSGCGKTTTLRCIAGLERPESGDITIAGEPVYSAAQKVFVAPHRRPIGMVFQSYAIWPHMTVFNNVAYPLRAMKPRPSKSEIAQRVGTALAAVQLGEMAGRSATKLSGGQQQRLALARAIVSEPQLLLLDEPLSNLDAKLRYDMRAELISLQRRVNVTSVYVTHDQAEALALSDVIVVMHAGRVQQIGRPRDIYDRPANRFVAEFIGTVNWIEGTVAGIDDGAEALTDRRSVRVKTAIGEIVSASRIAVEVGQRVLLSVRPEYVEVEETTTEGVNVLPGIVSNASFVGESIDATVTVGDVVLKVRLHPSRTVEVNDRVSVYLAPERCVLVSADQD